MDLSDFRVIKYNLSFWHKARLNLIEYLLNKHVDKGNNRKILDVGCGTGTELKVLKKFGRVTALDVDQEAIELAKNNKCDTLIQNIEKKKLPEIEYDLVCCFDILEHLNKDVAVMKNIYNSLKTGGLLILTVPSSPCLFGPHDIALNHKRRYKKNELFNKLIMTNYKIIKINYWNSILYPLIFVLRIIKKILFNIEKKKKPKTDLIKLNNTINNLLFYLLSFENCLIKNGVNLPFGLSIYAIAKK